ncbi:hypothetical protein H6G36_25650 [Anabaena minutissima FACHB-250]|nr:hypothetical protein [Anabaena minutissima FACHB-250]
MITIDSPYLSEFTPKYSAAIVSEAALTEDNFAPLVALDFGGNESVVIENPTGAEQLPEDWQQVTIAIANGQVLTPANNPESPQIGEFLYNPYTNTVEVFTVSPVRSLIIYGSPRTIPFAPPLLPPPYPALFTNIPIQGTGQIDRSLENHPSAQFELESTLRKAQLQAIFAPGSELDLSGIPLRINNANITELPRAIYPDSRCKISISFGGKWENYLDEPVFLRSDGKSPIVPGGVFQDPECATGTATSTSDPNRSTTVPRLLGKIGIPYRGPVLEPVDIPGDTPLDATVNPLQLLDERVRIANSFIRWSSADGVEIVPINGLPVWTYQEAEILGEVETSYEAIARTSKTPMQIPNLNPPAPDLVNFPSTVTPAPVPLLSYSPLTALSFEYPNVELTGDFNERNREQEELTQGNSKPRYVRKPVTRNERIDGDVDAHVPPDGVFSVQVMSLCFDIGGPTKNRAIVTEEDGAEVSIINEAWGFVFYADEIYNPATGKLSGNPNEYWKCLKRTRTDYIYDKATGYLLYVYESGYNTVRYRQESAENPETLELDPAEDEYSLYKFFQIPVQTRTSYFLRLMPDYSTEGAVEYIKVCNRDGTASLQAVYDPNFAPPYYVESERSESVAFASRPNPENEGLTIEAGDRPAPDLIVGEESRFDSYTQVIEAVYEEKLVGFEGGYPVYERGQELSPAKFVKYQKKFKAQGAQIAEAIEETSIEQGTEMPPQATRRPPVYVREEADTRDKLEEVKPEYRYFLRTAGYGESDPVGGSESFPLAKTFDDALTAAKCKAAIENWRNGLQERLRIAGNLRIKEGDRFNYYCNGELRERIVLSVSHSFNILGLVAGKTQVTLTTDLTLGAWRLPPVEFSKVLIPRQELSGSAILVVDQTLGEVLPWSRIRSRRNPEAQEI